MNNAGRIKCVCHAFNSTPRRCERSVLILLAPNRRLKFGFIRSDNRVVSRTASNAELKAHITRVFLDKHGKLVGHCQIDNTSGAAIDSPVAKKTTVGNTFFFHGTPATGGFRCRGDAGVVETAGLQLCVGDRLAALHVVRTETGMNVKRACLDVISAEGQPGRLTAYLEGLAAALRNEATQEAALAFLGQRQAGLTVWNTIATAIVACTVSPLLCVNTLALLADLAKRRDSTGRMAKKTLQELLSCDIFLPLSSPLRCILQAEPKSREEARVRKILVPALLNMWVECDRHLHRRIFSLLRIWVHKHPGEVGQVVKPDLLIQLLGSTLPHGNDLLCCYSWRELPLHLLQSEIHVSEEPAQLRCVKKHGGSYETFDDYMDTYVSLLRENAFANMRTGLHDFGMGKLDSRDMRIYSSVKLVSMSPPATDTRGEGTVLGLRTGGAGGGRLRLPMFGSLLAVAPHGNFEDVVWATVAGAREVKGALEIFAELCAGMGYGQADWHVVAKLLRNSGGIAVAESPTFYRAYQPALIVLQNQQEWQMPFFDEIVLGVAGFDQPSIEGMCVDGSVAFKTADPSYDADLTRIDAIAFVRALDYFASASNLDMDSGSQPQWFGGVPLQSTVLDASQCEALKSALTRRVTMVQGPPGCGKTFVGVRVARLISSLKPASIIPFEGASQGQPDDGPILVVTYKNVALDDFLGDCMKVWPAGVARLGGRPQEGSSLEKRHMRVLLREANRSTAVKTQTKPLAIYIRV